LESEEKLRALRVYELALARGEERAKEMAAAVQAALSPGFPDADWRVNRELSRVLCFLGDASIIDDALDCMASDAGDRPALGPVSFVRNPKYGAAIRDILESAPRMERMHHAQMLAYLVSGGHSEASVFARPSGK
jgi:hypothetical protein